MSPLLWVFFIGSVIAHGHTVVTSIKGTDQSRMSEIPHEYHAWSAPRWEQVADKRGGCDVRFFALSTERSRLKVDEVEQVLDTSWFFDYRIKSGESKSVVFMFIHPVSRETETRTVRFNCLQSVGRSQENWWER